MASLPPAKIYWENSFPRFSSNTLFNILKHYLPGYSLSRLESRLSKDALDNVDFEQFVQSLFNHPDCDLRKYSSPKALLAELKSFVNFPGAHRFFGAEDSCPMFQKIPRPYESLRRKLYIEKKDLCVHLQNMMLELCKDMLEDELVFAIFMAEMKSDEVKFADICEFVYVYDVEFPSMELQLKSALRDDQFMNIEGPKMPENFTYESILETINYMLYNYEEDVYPGIASVLRKKCQEKPPGRHKAYYTKVLRTVSQLTELTSMILRPRASMFLPESVPFGKAHLPDNSRRKLTLRLFEDERAKFSLVKDIRNVLDHRDLQGLSDMSTVDVKHVLRMVTESPIGAKVEIIKIPIRRTEHRALLIQIPEECYGKLAADVFFEITDAIFDAKVFQKIKETKWEDQKQFFDSLKLLFDCDEPRIYFMEARLLSLDRFWGFSERPVNQIRSVGPKGFTVEDLKNELVHLELHDFFPNILDHAEVVHSFLAKKKEILETSDLFAGVDHCQLICLVERLPNIQQFLHNQQACHRVLHKTCCDSEPPTPKLEVAQSRRPVEPQEPQASDSSRAADVKASLSDADAPSEHSHSEAATSKKKKKKKKNKKPKQKTVEEDDKEEEYFSATEDIPSSSPMPKQTSPVPPTPALEDQKKSVECAKCIRTKEFHDDAKNKLKSATDMNEEKKMRLAYLEGQGEGRKPRDVLEKELEEAVKMIEKLEKDNDDLEKIHEASGPEIVILEAELQRYQSEIDRLSELKEQNDECIRSLKEHIPKEVILGYRDTVRHTREMIRVQSEYRTAREDLRGGIINEATLKMAELMRLKAPAKEYSIAHYHVETFKKQCRESEEAVVKAIEKMQTDMFITPSEVPPLPEVPVLSDYVEQAVKNAQEVLNQELDRECAVCSVADDKERVYCQHCKRQTAHLHCCMKWWTECGEKRCPLCNKALS